MSAVFFILSGLCFSPGECGCQMPEDGCAESAGRPGGLCVRGQRHALAGPPEPDPPLRCGAHTPNENGSNTQAHTHTLQTD